MKKKVTLDEVLGERMEEDYKEQCAYIESLLLSGTLKVIKASGLNGKKPPLYRAYWEILEEKDYSEYEEELSFGLHPQIQVGYYRKNLEVYEREREKVLLLSSFLTYHRESLQVAISKGERSFEIFGEEKYLAGEGNTLLRHCGMDVQDVNVYETVEPFAYYAHERSVPQKLLILENKDPFFSMRRHLLAGGGRILGEEISTLIYGGGKRALSSFKAFEVSAEPYMLDSGNTYLYFGDLDYEGISIYEELKEVIAPRVLLPFTAAYEAMLRKTEGREIPLPHTKKGQRKGEGRFFFQAFAPEMAEKMKEILMERKYIPQESLDGRDFESEC